MQNQQKYYPLLILLLVLFSLISKANAEDLQASQQVILGVSEKIQQKLKDKAFAQDFNQVTQFVNSVIYPHTDFDKISSLVLGKHWKLASAEEKQRFKREFQTLIVRTYSRAFVEYTDWTIRFLPIDPSDDANKVVVKTEVLQSGLQPVEINYRMFLKNGAWNVYDILIDGVSLVTNYRSTFNDEIQAKGSLNAVIDSLIKRNTEALAAKGS